MQREEKIMQDNAGGPERLLGGGGKKALEKISG